MTLIKLKTAGLKFAAALALIGATPVAAQVDLRFVESAPKDRFELTASAACAGMSLDVYIDLSTAPAGLIFDTTAQGAGVEVFQPFEVARGEALLIEAGTTADGDFTIALQLMAPAPGESFVFTIDVDDTAPSSSLGQIRVSDAEIAGATFRVNGVEAAFDGNATAQVAAACAV